MTTAQQLDQAREKLSLAGRENLLMFNRWKAASIIKGEILKPLLAGLNAQEDEWHAHRSNVNSLIGCDAGARYASACALVCAMNTEYSAAIAGVGPILDQIAALEITLAQELHQATLARVARQSEIDQAKSHAIAAVEARFSTPEPSAPAAPEKPFRGKVTRPEAQLV